MKKIIYKCDYCGKEEEISYPSGYSEQQRLWVVGYYDACIECSVKAGEHLIEGKENSKKNK